MPDLDPASAAALKAASPEIEPDDADTPAPLPEDDDPARMYFDAEHALAAAIVLAGQCARARQLVQAD